MQNNLSAYHI